jgi:hypothetical protein
MGGGVTIGKQKMLHFLGGHCSIFGAYYLDAGRWQNNKYVWH